MPKEKPEVAAPTTMPAYSNVIIPPPAMAAADTDTKKVQKEAEEEEAKGNDEEDLDKLSLLERVRKY